MTTEQLDVVPVLALLASGAAATALEPRNRAARLMLLTGVMGLASSVLTPLARVHERPTVGALLERQAALLSFLLLSAGLTTLLLVFPTGAWSRPWHRSLATSIFALALVAPLLQVLGSARVVGNGADDTVVSNVASVPGLRVLGTVADLVTDLEPAWFVLGVVLFALRVRRATGDERRQLRPLLLAVVGLGLLLVLVIAEEIGGFSWPQPAFRLLFLAAVTAVPFVLLAGISRRSRTLNAELAASRTRLLSAEDDARRRLERDLHDGVQQQLVALLSLSSLAARQADQQNPRVTETLHDVRAQLTDAIEELRELVNGIRPPALTDSGVAAALESRLRRLPPEVTMDVGAARDRRWASETEAAAYFVACEAVANALKHAPGAPVHVRLLEREGGLEVEVADEGPGVAPGPSTGTGLQGLRDRVDSIGGALHVLPGPRGGTLVRAVFSA